MDWDLVWRGCVLLAFGVLVVSQYGQQKRMDALEARVAKLRGEEQHEQINGAAVVDLHERMNAMERELTIVQNRAQAAIDYIKENGETLRPVLEDPDSPLDSDISLLERRGWVKKARSGESVRMEFSVIGTDGPEVAATAIRGENGWYVESGGRSKWNLPDATAVLLWMERNG